MLKDFKPALIFLAKFLIFYFVSNIAYGAFVESYKPAPDPITDQVTRQTAGLLHIADNTVHAIVNKKAPTVFIKRGEVIVVNVFEGCNGVNVMIVFVAFLIAFGRPKKKLIIFLVFGLCMIHLANLGRLSLLYYTAQHYQQYFYFFHKYFFTAILYLIVFALWIIWVVRFNNKAYQNTK
jgi:exosortase family protein XrtF